ncbi:hypothetical protein QBC36DRAFT_100746 [Triangularia setosa]|uniref:Uncharacterized protein n=1 Tax=Triangularia setosa TaxID=2587417 RepID=A0AAN6VXN9_9PEZI|nr:hypothetical protein QBC36DRAFT_100746 [Podospora setosa]
MVSLTTLTVAAAALISTVAGQSSPPCQPALANNCGFDLIRSFADENRLRTIVEQETGVRPAEGVVSNMIFTCSSDPLVPTFSGARCVPGSCQPRQNGVDATCRNGNTLPWPPA